MTNQRQPQLIPDAPLASKASGTRWLNLMRAILKGLAVPPHRSTTNGAGR